MGVYHLMGLGNSPGAVTGSLSYLAYRYKRWNTSDIEFFGRSGEIRQRDEGKKVGDVQAFVVFTTREVLDGKLVSRPYTENQRGTTHGKTTDNKQPMKEVLKSLLPSILRDISHRKTIDLFWCNIDRRDIRNVYERVIRVVAALSGVGGQGKEMWANLTSGNNVTNFALELAATLSGQIARLYYVQAQNEDAEKCVNFTSEQNYWVDLPVMPLQMGRLSHAILNLLSRQPGLGEKELYGQILNHENYWNLVQGVSPDVLKENYLVPMWKQRLIFSEKEQSGNYHYYIGSQWQVIEPYETEWQQARNSAQSIEQMATQNDWLEYEKLNL